MKKIIGSMTLRKIQQKMNNIKLISVTPDAERLMAYCTIVSNPNNQG